MFQASQVLKTLWEPLLHFCNECWSKRLWHLLLDELLSWLKSSLEFFHLGKKKPKTTFGQPKKMKPLKTPIRISMPWGWPNQSPPQGIIYNPQNRCFESSSSVAQPCLYTNWLVWCQKINGRSGRAESCDEHTADQGHADSPCWGPRATLASVLPKETLDYCSFRIFVCFLFLRWGGNIDFLNLQLKKKKKRKSNWDFSGSPGPKTPHVYCRGHGFNP